MRKITPPEQTMSQDSPDAPLLPGQTRNSTGTNTPEWAYLTPQDLQVDTVIFSDGTWVGDAKDPIDEKVSEVRKLFAGRQSEADELTKWRDLIKTLPADNSAALSDFLTMVDATPLKEVGADYADGCRLMVLQSIKSTADQIRKMQSDGSSSAAQIRHKLDWISTSTARAAVNAVDAGPAVQQ